MNQDLMFFEAEAIAAEAAKCEAQRAAEKHEREAKAAAKVLLQAAREKIKAMMFWASPVAPKPWRRRTPAQARAKGCHPLESTPHLLKAVVGS